MLALKAKSKPARDEITLLLLAHRNGDRAAFDRLVPIVYDDLCRVARGVLRRSKAGSTLNTTALVHEAYFRLVDEVRVPWQSRSHFFAVAARAMRRILVDYARERCAQKRGGKAIRVPIDNATLAINAQAETVVAIDRALEALSAISQRLVDVVDCRLFAGMTEEETARALGSPLRTVQRDWQRARAWLIKDLPR